MYYLKVMAGKIFNFREKSYEEGSTYFEKIDSRLADFILLIIGNPVIVGLAAGSLTGNIYTGLTGAGFVLLYQGIGFTAGATVFFTVFLVNLSGNINFEIIFIFVITLFFVFEKAESRLVFLMAAIICFFSLSVWREIFGFIPAQVLNEFNIAGQVILLAGIILLTFRAEDKLARGEVLQSFFFLLELILAVACLYGLELTIIFTPIGIFLISLGSYYKKELIELNLDKKMLSFIILITGIIAFLILLPLLIPLLIIAAFLMLIIFYKKEISYLYLVYLALIIGLYTARFGLLY